MSLSDELDSLAASHRCSTCEWRASRTLDEQARIDEQMRALTLQDGRQKRYGRYMNLYNVCVRHGLQATTDAFRHHCRNHVAD